jgi:uncharacterized peroxidase-related enzyme
MSLITEIEQADATGAVAEVYQQAEEIMGYVPNALKMHSVNPPMLAQQFNYIGLIMQHATLSGKLFAAIRMMISVDQKCEYCIDLNVGMLINMYGMTADEVADLRANPEGSNLAAKEKALLLYTIRATKDANSVGETDIQQLRDLGCTDLEIYDAPRHGASQVMMDIMLNSFKGEKE